MYTASGQELFVSCCGLGGIDVFKGFKHFLARGNVFELAVGIIVGTAFNHIVTSLVDDIIMPPIGLILHHVNFNNLYFNLTRRHYPSLSAAKAAGAPTINYGSFINQVIDFLIIAVVIYFLVERFERFKGPDDPDPITKPCPYCTLYIPVDATRCPECTAELPEPPADDE